VDYLLLGSYLAVLSVVFGLFFSYLFQRDKSKCKLMFLLVFVYSFFIRVPEMIPSWETTQIVQRIDVWGPLPIISAILIAVTSNMLNQKNFRNSFRVFLLVLAASTFLIFLPLPVNLQPELVYLSVSVATISVSSYVILRRRRLSDFMFLLSTVCFALAEVGSSFLGSGIEFVVFAYTCAHMFLALVFVARKESGMKGIISGFALERELEKTQQELEISQNQLTRAEYNFKSLVNAIADPVAIVNNKGEFLEINDKIIEMTGFSKDDLIGKNFMKTDIVTAKSKALLIKNLAKRMMGINIKPYEIEAKTRDGESIYLEVNAQKIEYENKSAELVVFHDITERKIMEKKLEKYAEQLEEKVKERTKTLKENEEKLRSIFNSSPDAIAVSDLKGNIIECNKATLDFLGFSTKDEVIGKNGSIFVAKHDQQKVNKTLNKVLVKGPLTHIEYTALNKDGYEFPAEFSTSAIKDHSGNPTGFVIIIENITERKRKEEELHKSETKNKAILNAIPDLMWQMNKDGVVLEFIPAKDFPTLVPPNQIVGKNIKDVAPKWFAKKVMQCTKQAFKTKEIQIFEYQLPFTSGSDEMHDYEARLVVGGEDIILSIVRDITERKRMENELRGYSEQLEELVEERTIALKKSQERLVKSEKLAAIGQAATMVGHDLRNPLQAIENGVYYISTELSNLQVSPKITETLQAVHNSVEYADNIVKDLQSFASKREPVFRKTDINTLVKETFSHIKQPENVETIMELKKLPKIEADTDMLQRIFVNLAINGIQAMEEKGGTMKVSTKKAKDCVEVKFEDKGIGIKKENITKIFTPFFTTKAQGMGVGLPICKRFVDIHEGNIEVESEEGKGSIFTVKLPIQMNGGVKCD
jgi:two-component system, NtrC family, sensor kinase